MTTDTNHFEKIIDSNLPHQLMIRYHTGNKLRATCNCGKWKIDFRPEEPDVLEEKVIGGYKDHLPKLE